jgi:hypothetical protein
MQHHHYFSPEHPDLYQKFNKYINNGYDGFLNEIKNQRFDLPSLPVLQQTRFNSETYSNLIGKINHYLSHNLSPPVALMNQYHEMNELMKQQQQQQQQQQFIQPINQNKIPATSTQQPTAQPMLTDTRNNYDQFLGHNNQPIIMTDQTSHHFYHYNEHPFYNKYGKEIIFTSGKLERMPSSSRFSYVFNFFIGI